MQQHGQHLTRHAVQIGTHKAHALDVNECDTCNRPFANEAERQEFLQDQVRLQGLESWDQGSFPLTHCMAWHDQTWPLDSAPDCLGGLLS